MLNAYIYDGLRSPIGRHGGKLSSVRPDDLLALVMKKLIEKSKIPVEKVEDVIIGCSIQVGEDSRNIARFSSVMAGLPVTVPAQTINRLCASGLGAVVDAARAITAGEGDIYIAGGVESMTRAPFVIPKAESAYSRDSRIYDTTLGSRFPNPKFTELHGSHSMPETGDNVAKKFGISREEADLFALSSQQKYQEAKKRGYFDAEIVPIEVSQGKRLPPIVFNEDEHPRAGTTLESLTKLNPLFKDGIVTAGNASGVNDGAAALVIGSAFLKDELNMKPLAKILSAAAVGIEPSIMGAGPIEAIKKAVSRASLTLDQVDIIEINEAFASQVLACLKGLNVDFNDPRVNPNGGAIALGHPLGCSGARLALTTARQLKLTNKRYAVISLCVGLGQGLAMVIENTDFSEN